MGTSSLKNRSKRSYHDRRSNPPYDHDFQSVKKTRFDQRNPSTLAADVGDEEENAILDLDEIGKKGPQAKRNAVRLDGYDSDSSDGNFDARAETKAEAMQRSRGSATKSQDEDINDMFADLEDDFEDGDDDEGLDREGKRRKKEVKFVEIDEIAGQDEGSRPGNHITVDFSQDQSKRVAEATEETSSDSDEEADESTRAEIDASTDKELGAGGKKTNAPRIDAFNMRNEAEEGKFDDSGNFVRRAADPYAVHDTWLGGYSKTDMKRAKEAHARREAERRKRDISDDAVSIAAIISVLVEHMENGETVLEAIARIGKKNGKQKSKWQKARRNDISTMQVDTKEIGDAPRDAMMEQRRIKVEAVTEAADQLLTRGQADIYDTERGSLMRQYRRETGEDWNAGISEEMDCVDGANPPTSEHREWIYRWADGRDQSKEHGPYKDATMRAWIDAGYFGEGVEFRETGSNKQWMRGPKPL